MDSRGPSIDTERSTFSFARSRKPSNTKLARISQDRSSASGPAGSEVSRRSSIGGLRNLFSSKPRLHTQHDPNISLSSTTRSRTTSEISPSVGTTTMPTSSAETTRSSLTTRLPLKSVSSQDLRRRVDHTKTSKSTLNHSVSLSELVSSKPPNISTRVTRPDTPSEPLPLIRGYRQAIKHGNLVTPVLAADVVLRLASQKQISSAIPAPIIGVTEGRVAAAAKKFDRGRSRPLKPTPSPISRLEWTRGIFVLTNSGVLCQYTADGPTNRLPDKMMQLGKDSAAHLCTAIPGRPWVIQIMQVVDEKGIPVQATQTLRSRFHFRSTESKRPVTCMLLVVETERDLEVWLNFVRKVIESLGGRKHWTGDEVDEVQLASNNTNFFLEVPRRDSGVRSSTASNIVIDDPVLSKNRLSFNPDWTMPVAAAISSPIQEASGTSTSVSGPLRISTTANMPSTRPNNFCFFDSPIPNESLQSLPTMNSTTTNIINPSIGIASSTDKSGAIGSAHGTDRAPTSKPVQANSFPSTKKSGLPRSMPPQIRPTYSDPKTITSRDLLGNTAGSAVHGDQLKDHGMPFTGQVPTSVARSSLTSPLQIIAPKPLVLRAFPVAQVADPHDTVLVGADSLGVAQPIVRVQDQAGLQSSENFESRSSSRISQIIKRDNVLATRQNSKLAAGLPVGGAVTAISIGCSSVSHNTSSSTRNSSPEPSEGNTSLGDIDDFVLPDTSCLNLTYPRHSPRVLLKAESKFNAPCEQSPESGPKALADKGVRKIEADEIMPDDSISHHSRTDTLSTEVSAFSIENYQFPVPFPTSVDTVNATHSRTNTADCTRCPPDSGKVLQYVSDSEYSQLDETSDVSIVTRETQDNSRASPSIECIPNKITSEYSGEKEVKTTRSESESELSSPVQAFVTPLQSPLKSPPPMPATIREDPTFGRTTIPGEGDRSERNEDASLVGSENGLGIMLRPQATNNGKISEAARFSMYGFATKAIPERELPSDYSSIRDFQDHREISTSTVTPGPFPRSHLSIQIGETRQNVTQSAANSTHDQWDSQAVLPSQLRPLSNTGRPANSPELAKTRAVSRPESQQKFNRLLSNLSMMVPNQATPKIVPRHISGPLPIKDEPQSLQRFAIPRDHPVPGIKADASDRPTPKPSKSANDIRSRVQKFEGKGTYPSVNIRARAQLFENPQATNSSSTLPLPPQFFATGSHSLDSRSPRWSSAFPSAAHYRPPSVQYTASGTVPSALSSAGLTNRGKAIAAATVPMSYVVQPQPRVNVKTMDKEVTTPTLSTELNSVHTKQDVEYVPETLDSSSILTSFERPLSSEKSDVSVEEQATKRKSVIEVDNGSLRPCMESESGENLIENNSCIVSMESVQLASAPPSHMSQLHLEDKAVVDDLQPGINSQIAEPSVAESETDELEILENIRMSILSSASRRSIVSSSRSLTISSIRSEGKDSLQLDTDSLVSPTTPNSAKSEQKPRPLSIVPPIRGLRPSRDSIQHLRDIPRARMRSQLPLSNAVIRDNATKHDERNVAISPRRIIRNSSFQPSHRTSLLLTPEELSRRLGLQPTSKSDTSENISTPNSLKVEARSEREMVDSIDRMTVLLSTNNQDFSGLTPLEPPSIDMIQPLWYRRSHMPARFEIHRDSTVLEPLSSFTSNAKHESLTIPISVMADNVEREGTPALSSTSTIARTPLRATSSNIVRPDYKLHSTLPSAAERKLVRLSHVRQQSPTYRHGAGSESAEGLGSRSVHSLTGALPLAAPPNIPLPPLPPKVKQRAQSRRDNNAGKVIRSQEITAWTEDVGRENRAFHDGEIVERRIDAVIEE